MYRLDKSPPYTSEQLWRDVAIFEALFQLVTADPSRFCSACGFCKLCGANQIQYRRYFPYILSAFSVRLIAILGNNYLKLQIKIFPETVKY